MKKIILLLALFLCSKLWATTPGFRSGNEFRAVSVQGTISVRCVSPQGSTTAFHSCRDNILYPGDLDFFYHPDKVAGDKVSLRVEQSNGTIRESSKKYDSATGLSTRRFNLWINTLFQRALLNNGLNKVDYEVTQRGVITDMGSFDVLVSKSDDVQVCRRRHYFSSDMTDCRSSQSLCARYFREQNYCQ